MLADAGKHVLQGAPRRPMGMDVVSRHQGHAAIHGDGGKHCQTASVITVIKILCSEIESFFKVMPQLIQGVAKGPVEGLRRDGDDDLTGTVGDDVSEAEIALSLGRAPSSDGQEAR